MGFSVTASQVILLVAAFGAGSALTTAVLGAAGNVEDGYRDAWRARESVVHTNLTVVDDASWPSYDATAERFDVRVENVGSTVLEVSAFTFLVDGAYANEAVATMSVDGDASTDLFLPGETLEVSFTPVTPSPSTFKIVSGNGASAYWRS